MAEEKLKTVEEKKSFLEKIPKDSAVFLIIVGAFFVLISGNLKLSGGQLWMMILLFFGVLFFLSKSDNEQKYITFRQAREIAYNWISMIQQQPYSKILDGEIRISPKSKLKRSPWDGKPLSWVVVTEVVGTHKNQEYYWEIDYYTGDITTLDEKLGGVIIEEDAKDFVYVPPKDYEIRKRLYGEE